MKKYLPVFVIIVLGFSNFQQSFSQNTWTFLGPEDAYNLTSLHLDKQNDVLFVGTIEGLWYYDINTTIWTSRIESGWIGREVWSLTSHPEFPGRVITGRVNAFFKGYMEISHDWGATNSLTFNSDGGLIKDVKFCPTQPDLMFASGWSDITPGDLLKSTDGGQSWVQLTNYLHTAMTEINIHPNSPDTLYVSGDALVTKSVDGGNTWVQSSSGLPTDLGVYCIDIDPFQPQSLLCSNDNGIYKTNNGGDTWEFIHNEDCQHFANNPVFEGIVAAITFPPYKVLLSYDHGESWQDYTGEFPGDNLMDIVFSEDGTQIYVASLSGVYSREIDVTGMVNPQSNYVSFYNYPNPFSAQTTIKFHLPEYTTSVILAIFNLKGQKIKCFTKYNLLAGEYSEVWDRTDIAGDLVTPDIYICKISVVGKNIVVSKMVVVD